MSHYFFVTFLIVSIYLIQSMVKTENLDNFNNNKMSQSTNNFPNPFNNSFCSPNLKHGFNTWKPKELITILVVIATLLLFFRLTNKINSISIHGRSKNLGVVSGWVLFPWRLPIFDLIYSLILTRVGGVKVFEEWVKRFGNLFEIQAGPCYLTIISDPDVLQKVLSSTQPEHLNRPTLYRNIFYDAFCDGVVTSDFEAWCPQRKRLSRCFTYKSLHEYLKFINTHAKNLTRGFIAAADDKTFVEGKTLQTLIYRHTYKIIAQILLDTDRFGDDENAELSDAFCRFKDLMVDRLMNPLSLGHYLWFHPKKREYDQLKHFFSEGKTENLELCKAEMEKVEKTEGKDDSNDLGVNIKPFRCIIKELLCSGASDKEICDQIGTIAGTGHETSVVAIQMLLMNLATNPESQVKCREEVDRLFNCKTLFNGGQSFDCELSMEDILNLKYLDMCILESGRLHSTVPIILRRLDSPLKVNEEVLLGAGTSLGISLWTLHRDPKHFPNPEKFDPDRFLCEHVKKRHPYAYIPFSAGKRDCIGSKVAHLQIKVFMTWIIRHFEISSTDKIDDVKLLIGLTIVPERPFNIVLKRRRTN